MCGDVIVMSYLTHQVCPLSIVVLLFLWLDNLVHPVQNTCSQYGHQAVYNKMSIYSCSEIWRIPCLCMLNLNQKMDY